MVTEFLAHMRIVPDHRIPGMVTYPLDEILLTTLVGVICGADDWDGVEEVAAGALDWLRGYLPFENGVATAQTLRKVSRLLDPKALEQGFSAWAASVRPLAREVIAVDGKTLRGSRQSDGTGALHLVSAYATSAGLVLAQRAVDGKSNEITAIPELLDMLDIKGAIVSIDAMGTQKAIAARIVEKGADYVLALKGNQTSLHDDARLFFADPAGKASCARESDIDAGHGRIEERLCRAADAAWLAERHPEWKGLRSLVAIASRRIDKRTGAESLETRFYISSLEPDPQALAAAVRAHWAIENNLHWTMDVIFDEDRCRTRKDHSPLNLAVIRHAAFNMLKADKTKGSMRRKRLRARVDPNFRATLFAA
ncbi:ISAs1 family transposase [Methylosinus sp. Ce-a6]|uniref:ISAs1 family transposase n=1 Tax=Methylosinus sp. Ce-a6 TaxID=2172005 RepID=UPI00135A2878|nr:ISAs1 family transposase [Methylosinus sp. Ce-a6]